MMAVAIRIEHKEEKYGISLQKFAMLTFPNL